MTFYNNSPASTAKFICFDIEFATDQALFDRYARQDPRPVLAARWPMRRLIAASVLSLSVEDGIVEVEEFQSFSGPDEAAVARALFSFFDQRPMHRAVSWGGVATDSNILRCAAGCCCRWRRHPSSPPDALAADRKRRIRLWRPLRWAPDQGE